jgi:hypothetical protein
LLRTKRFLRTTITAFLSLACAAHPVSGQPQIPSHISPAELWLSGAAVQGGLVVGRVPEGAHSLFLDDMPIVAPLTILKQKRPGTTRPLFCLAKCKN